MTSPNRSRAATEEVRSVLNARGRKRLEMIVHSSDPAALVRSLPEREVFLTIKEVGERDAVDLVALTTPNQLLYILDLDLWKRDEIDPGKSILWLQILESCGEHKVRQFFKTADPEFLVAMLRKLVRVTKVESVENEPGTAQDQSLFTLDRMYYLEFLDRRARMTLPRILDVLWSRNPTFYQGLMESVLWAIPAEDETLALRWRKGRLADHGFPDFQEALEIYRSVPLGRVRQEKLESPSEPEPPSYPPTWVNEAGQGSFFSLVLQEDMDQATVTRLQWEIAGLANRILVADAADPAEAEAVYRSIRKAFQTLDLGLRYLSQEDPVEATRVLETTPVVRIFQAGFTLTLRLKWKAESILRDGWLRAINRGIEILDSPFLETMKGLLRKRPLFFSGEVNGNVRPFERLEEVALIRDRLEKISAMGKLVHEYLGVSAEQINRIDTARCYLPDPPLSTICLTALANRLTRGEKDLEPITGSCLERLHRSLIERVPDRVRGRVKADTYHLFAREFVPEGEPVSGGTGKTLRWWIEFLVGRVESSLGGIRPGMRIDPRYIDAFMVKRERDDL